MISLENQESRTHTSNKGDTKQTSGELMADASTGKFDISIIQIPSLKARVKIGRQRTKNSSISLSQLEAGKEIISKQLHDNALIEFEKFASENHLLHTLIPGDTPELGQYVKITSTFKFHDLDLFKKIANKQLADLFIIRDLKEAKELEIEKAKRDTPAIKNDKHPIIKEIENRYAEPIKNTEKQFSMIEEVFGFVSKVLPSDYYIKLGNIVAPLKEEFMREKPRDIAFKYGNEVRLCITLIGKVTRRYENLLETEAINHNPTIMQAIHQVSSSVENILTELELLNPGDYIVSPVAIFFE
jgi:hypothetical protein